MDTSSQTDPQRLGKYELRELLGRSYQSEVWKGFDPQLRRYVAIKILYTHQQKEPHFMADLERKLQAIASLHHPNIVQVHDYHIFRSPEPNDMVAYLVTDYVEGSSLADYIRSTSGRRIFPPPIDIVRIFTAISIALDYAHQQGVIHRDIKPTNILGSLHRPPDVSAMAPTGSISVGEPMLTDFGNVTLLGTSKGTMSSSWLGNPFYVSPEQTQGAPGNEFSDIYALGVILYEICTGVVPFQGSNAAAIIMQHINAAPTPPALIHANIPPAVTMVILRSLAKDPAARFANASSMAAALAEAFDVPVPESLSQFASARDSTNSPTHYNLRQHKLSAGTTPSSPALPIVRSSTPPPPNLATTQRAASPDVGLVAGEHNVQNSPLVPAGGMPASSSPVDSIASLPTIVRSQRLAESVLPNTSTPPAKKRRRGLRVALIALLILLLLSSGLSALYLLSQKSFIATGNTAVGYAFFESSGRLSQDSVQRINDILGINKAPGMNDELQITLHKIPAPAPNKSYYAWLLGDKKQNVSSSILLGKLLVNHGDVNFLYQGDSLRSDLLEITSRILITQEDEHTIPSAPSQNTNAWRYYVELPQVPMDAEHYSLLDRIRHLLSGDSTLDALGLRGGLDFWLLRNTALVLEWAGSARDYWKSQSTTLMRNHLIRILEYLDSASYAQADVPVGTPLKIVDQRIAQVGLLELDTQRQNPPGYLYSIGRQCLGIVNAPGTTVAQRTIATQVKRDLNNVTTWLEKVRQDAKYLIHLTDEQLLLPSSLLILDDMTTSSFYAYAGHLDPSTNQVLGGVIQIHYNLQRLASFDITQYKP